MIETDDETMTRPCERCHKTALCQEIPLMGFSLWLCAKCAAEAYHNGEAI